MNSRHATLRVLATAALIFTVAGLSGYPSSAKTAGNVPTLAPRLDLAQPTNARPITAMLLDDPEAIYEGARIVHNVTVDGVKGMRVHAKFHVRYGIWVTCLMIAYFDLDDCKKPTRR